MQHFRSSLTRLRGLMEQRLPDGNDIYGYPGVTKTSLLAAIDAVYPLSQEIKQDAESRFEVISLKRAGSELYTSLKDFLEADSADEEHRTRFNDFLNNLSTLIEKTKITYFIVAKKGIRDDEELARIRSTIAELTVLGDELKEQKEAVASEIESISAAVDGINASHKSGDKLAAEIKQWHSTASEHYTKIEETHEAITGWDEDIRKCSVQFQTVSNQVSELAITATQSRDKLSSFATEGEKAAEALKKTAREHRELLDEIRKTLEGANRAGMAASFNARKDELGLQQIAWQLVFIGAIPVIVLSVWKLILPTITADTTQWTKLIAELGVVSPLIWLGWFAAKQYGYTSKIREDYAFKSAAAMAYEGHKKAAREVNKELERILLEFSLFNMSQNPIRLYEGDMHGTPIHEVMDQLLRKFPNLKKVSAEVPTLGRFEIAGKESKRKKRDRPPMTLEKMGSVVMKGW